ncbi:hypothetical protein AMQ84_15070 [Paenibacillus riograndensis]|uniref:Uncharacterized protein n=1 Tax=Paenibacillus riograndensis TaxID=483937 RepID=A0A132TYE3_9BACL|nr:hypothetical protein AMQ84_15070 [Paenibacillus riograndensis]
MTGGSSNSCKGLACGWSFWFFWFFVFLFFGFVLVLLLPFLSIRLQSILQIYLILIVASLECRAAAWILLHFLQLIIPKSDKKQILLHFRVNFIIQFAE